MSSSQHENININCTLSAFSDYEATCLCTVSGATGSSYNRVGVVEVSVDKVDYEIPMIYIFPSTELNLSMEKVCIGTFLGILFLILPLSNFLSHYYKISEVTKNAPTFTDAFESYSSYMKENIFSHYFSGIFSDQSASRRYLNELFQHVSILSLLDLTRQHQLVFVLKYSTELIVAMFVLVMSLHIFYPADVCKGIVNEVDCVTKALSVLSYDYYQCDWLPVPDNDSYGLCTGSSNIFSISIALIISLIAALTVTVISFILEPAFDYLRQAEAERYDVLNRSKVVANFNPVVPSENLIVVTSPNKFVFNRKVVDRFVPFPIELEERFMTCIRRIEESSFGHRAFKATNLFDEVLKTLDTFTDRNKKIKICKEWKLVIPENSSTPQVNEEIRSAEETEKGNLAPIVPIQADPLYISVAQQYMDRIVNLKNQTLASLENKSLDVIGFQIVGEFILDIVGRFDLEGRLYKRILISHSFWYTSSDFKTLLYLVPIICANVAMIVVSMTIVTTSLNSDFFVYFGESFAFFFAQHFVVETISVYIVKCSIPNLVYNRVQLAKSVCFAHLEEIRSRRDDSQVDTFSSSRYLFLAYLLAKEKSCTPEKFFVMSFISSLPGRSLHQLFIGSISPSTILLTWIPSNILHVLLAVILYGIITASLLVLESFVHHMAFIVIGTCCGLVIVLICVLRFRASLAVEVETFKPERQQSTRLKSASQLSIDDSPDSGSDDALKTSICIHCSSDKGLRNHRVGVILCLTCSTKYCTNCAFQEATPAQQLCKQCVDEVCSMCSKNSNIVLRRSKHGKTVCRDCKMTLIASPAAK